LLVAISGVLRHVLVLNVMVRHDLVRITTIYLSNFLCLDSCSGADTSTDVEPITMLIIMIRMPWSVTAAVVWLRHKTTQLEYCTVKIQSTFVARACAGTSTSANGRATRGAGEKANRRAHTRPDTD
jgi:hypothetical protein